MAKERGESPSSFILWAKFFDLLRLLVVNGLYAWLAYMAYRSIETLAGKVTSADIDVAISYLTSKGNDYGLPWVVAIVCVFWALMERRLRRKKTASMADTIKQLQLRIDPNRTSSGLLPSGETNPQDKTL